MDETNGALDAVKILEGHLPSPFATGWYQVPNAYFYALAGLFKIAGVNFLALKLASIIPAVLTVLALFFLARELWGSLPALCAMLLMAVSCWHLTMSRWGWVEVTAPLLQILAVWFLLRALRLRRTLDYALSGFLTGLAMYTYLSALPGSLGLGSLHRRLAAVQSSRFEDLAACALAWPAGACLRGTCGFCSTGRHLHQGSIYL